MSERLLNGCPVSVGDTVHTFEKNTLKAGNATIIRISPQGKRLTLRTDDGHEIAVHGDDRYHSAYQIDANAAEVERFRENEAQWVSDNETSASIHTLTSESWQRLNELKDVRNYAIYASPEHAVLTVSVARINQAAADVANLPYLQPVEGRTLNLQEAESRVMKLLGETEELLNKIQAMR